MRITKLRLLILFVLVGLGIFGFYLCKMKQAELREQEEKIKVELEKQKIIEAEATAKKAAEIAIATTAVVLPAEPQKKEPVEITYTVQKGDTLWSIAKKKEHFGLGHRWYDIWKANESSIFDFDKIVTGQVIVMPLDKPEHHPWRKTSEDKKRKLLGTEEKESSNSGTN